MRILQITPYLDPKLGGQEKHVIALSETACIDGYTGFLVQPDDVLELADVIAHLLTNEAESKEIGMRARERVMKMFSIESIVDKLENMYKEILSSAIS